MRVGERNLHKTDFQTKVVYYITEQTTKGVSMRNANNHDERDGEPVSRPMQRRMEYSIRKKPQVHQRSKAKRSSSDETAKRGIHQRRNKLMSW